MWRIEDMLVDKQVIERYRVLNECFRNPYGHDMEVVAETKIIN